jgi:hypothetical protein
MEITIPIMIEPTSNGGFKGWTLLKPLSERVWVGMTENDVMVSMRRSIMLAFKDWGMSDENF